METPTTCAGCSAQISAGTRFCRRCGRPSPYLNETSVTESTTQILPRAEALPINAAPPLASAYQAPLQNGDSSGEATRRSLESNKMTSNAKPHVSWAVYAMVLLIVACAVATIVFLKPRSQTQKIVIVRPSDGFVAAPPAIPHIAVPEVPRAPSALPAAESPNSDKDALVYPNAEIKMRVNRAGEGQVLQMSTTDALDTVADWYTSKLKPSRAVRENQNVVLDAGEVKAVITKAGNKTEIILHQTGLR